MATALGWYDQPEPEPAGSGPQELSPLAVWIAVPVMVLLFGAGFFRCYQVGGSCADCSEKAARETKQRREFEKRQRRAGP